MWKRKKKQEGGKDVLPGFERFAPFTREEVKNVPTGEAGIVEERKRWYNRRERLATRDTFPENRKEGGEMFVPEGFVR